VGGKAIPGGRENGFPWLADLKCLVDDLQAGTASYQRSVKRGVEEGEGCYE
jgi:hypothetical protein